MATITSAIIGRVLRNIGLRQRRSAGRRPDFAVQKLYAHGEVISTSVVFYTKQAEDLAWQYKSVIEEATRDLGYPFKVTRHEYGNGQYYIDVSN